VASLPLRLSLITSIFPVNPAFPACGAEAVAAGGSIFPIQPYTQVQLTPHLVLHGFSDLGCAGDHYAPLDTGAGGGFTYTRPLRPNLWLVASTGAYGVPQHSSLPARYAVSGGLDVAQRMRSSQILMTGLGVTAINGGFRVIPRVGGSF
jgi:hypothetical protein